MTPFNDEDMSLLMLVDRRAIRNDIIVVMTEKAKKNLQDIANMELEAMDLINVDSIDVFAEIFLAPDRPLHLLINNTGIMWIPLRKNRRGIES